MWRPVLASVPQGSILSSLLFHIYINDLLNKLKSNVGVLANDIPLFTIIKDNNGSSNIPNNDLIYSKWAYNWKMFFNSDPSKPAQKVKFSRKKKVQIHQPVSQNNIRVSYQKHLGIILDEKLNFKQYSAKNRVKI